MPCGFPKHFDFQKKYLAPSHASYKELSQQENQADDNNPKTPAKLKDVFTPLLS